MTPRPQIIFATVDDDVEGVVRLLTATGHTRLPLCEREGGLDAPVGLIHLKDLIQPAMERRPLALAGVARPLARVSESTLLSEVLRDLRREHQHLALVADEHGTTTGVVTLEDVLEELVGEIEDEFDTDVAAQVVHDGEVAVVDGRAPVRLLVSELGLRIDDPHEATIGGHLVETLGRVPQVGETLTLDGFHVEVCEVDEARIMRLRFARRRP